MAYRTRGSEIRRAIESGISDFKENISQLDSFKVTVYVSVYLEKHVEEDLERDYPAAKFYFFSTMYGRIHNGYVIVEVEKVSK